MAQDRQARQVQIGDEMLPIPPFKGFKAIRAGKLLARVTTQVQDLWKRADEFEEEYRNTHSMRITRQEANLRGWEHITFPEGQDHIEIPEPPADEQKFLEVFEKAFELIEDELVQMAALVLAPNKELKEAHNEDRDGGVNNYLERRGEELLHEANIGQLVDLAVAVKASLEDELLGKKAALAGIGNALGLRSLSPEREESRETTEEGMPIPDPTPPSDPEPEQTSQKTTSSQDSSTPSEPPTDGDQTKSSLESRGESSTASVPA